MSSPYSCSWGKIDPYQFTKFNHHDSVLGTRLRAGPRLCLCFVEIFEVLCSGESWKDSLWGLLQWRWMTGLSGCSGQICIGRKNWACWLLRGGKVHFGMGMPGSEWWWKWVIGKQGAPRGGVWFLDEKPNCPIATLLQPVGIGELPLSFPPENALYRNVNSTLRSTVPFLTSSKCKVHTP